MTSFWDGVIPAITTPFNSDGTVDHDFLSRHTAMMLDAGCTAIVPLGSLGETATLTIAEKQAILKTVLEAVHEENRSRGAGIPVIPGVAALGTDDAAAFARMAAEMGCGGLMVLPPYVYSSDWREMKHHVSAVIRA